MKKVAVEYCSGNNNKENVLEKKTEYNVDRLLLKIFSL